MTVTELLTEKRDEILAIASRHGAENVRVFGSTARGESSGDSDVDFLVTVGSKASPFFPVALVQELEELLGCKVDVVSEGGLYWLLRRRILREARPL